MSYLKAHEKYSGIRDAVYEITYNNWSPLLNNLDTDIKIFPIDINAIVYAEKVWENANNQNMPPIFPWRRIKKHYMKNPRHFDVAIWSGPILCGLATGRASRKNRSNITIFFLQGAPHQINPLKGYIAKLALSSFDLFGKILNKQITYIANPLAGAIPHYQTLGFSLASGSKSGKKLERVIK